MTCRRLAHFIIVCGVLVGIAVMLTAPATARPAVSENSEVDACVLQIGDVTGDGVEDFSVSVPAIRNGAVVVYLIAGHDQPLPTLLDPTYLRRNLAGVLEGPAAMPFICPADAVEPIRRIGGPAQVRLRRPIANTLIGQPVTYAMVDLDPLMPGYPIGFSSLASGINATGQVVGRFFTPEGERAFVYVRGAVRDLGTLGGQISEAQGINRSGRIVGRSLTGAVDNFGFISAAFAFDGTLMQNLNLDWGSAAAINDAGRIVGEMRFARGVDLLHAFLYDQGHATDLGSLPPLGDSAYSTAHSINDAGTVVGQSNTFVPGSAFPATRYPAVRAFEYADGAMRDLGSLGAMCSPFFGGERCVENSVATDINNSGTIVGFSSTPTTIREHAFVSADRRLQDLGTLGGSGSWAYAVNDSGQIVGGFSSADDRYRAPFLYERGTMYGLNDLIVNPSTAMPFAAYDIDNFGQIVGNHHLL